MVDMEDRYTKLPVGPDRQIADRPPPAWQTTREWGAGLGRKLEPKPPPLPDSHRSSRVAFAFCPFALLHFARRPDSTSASDNPQSKSQQVSRHLQNLVLLTLGYVATTLGQDSRHLGQTGSIRTPKNCTLTLASAVRDTMLPSRHVPAPCPVAARPLCRYDHGRPRLSELSPFLQPLAPLRRREISITHPSVPRRSEPFYE